MKTIFVAIICLFGLTALAAAQAPTAVVEDVQGKVSGVEFMDYVAPGKVIKLGEAGTIVLSYMKSCWREVISGVGTVIVGGEASMVHLSEVKGGKVQCDGGHSQPISPEVGESAASIVRGLNAKHEISPQGRRVFGLSPVIETSGHGKLVVERLDVKGERYDVDVTGASVVHGKFFDFARTGTTLTPGGIYAASLGSRRVVFSVDRQAEPGMTPIVGRLVRLE
jgi:hypothetical protein